MSFYLNSFLIPVIVPLYYLIKVLQVEVIILLDEWNKVFLIVQGISKTLIITRCPYLRIKNKMHYYSYVVGCAFFVVWLIFYSICDLKSRSLKGYLTKQLPVLYYIPTGSGGRSSSSGFRIECKGSKQKIPTSQESDSLYQIYGDSIINHIVVRFLLKEPFPDVYYVDSVGITYK